MARISPAVVADGKQNKTKTIKLGCKKSMDGNKKATRLESVAQTHMPTAKCVWGTSLWDEAS